MAIRQTGILPGGMMPQGGGTGEPIAHPCWSWPSTLDRDVRDIQQGCDQEDAVVDVGFGGGELASRSR